MLTVKKMDVMSVDGQSLKLIFKEDNDTIQADLLNPHYHTEKWAKIKTFVMLIMFIGLSTSMHMTNMFVLAIAVVLLGINLFLLLQLIDKESIEIVRDFTFQKTITRAFGRKKRSVVHRSKLHRLVINEVFEDQRVIFLLQLILKPVSPESTTPGAEADKQQQPEIFPMFEHLKPNRECLEFVYTRLKKKLKLYL